MQCNYPRIRAETHETYINKKGGKSYKVEWLSRDIWDEAQRNPKTKKWLQMKYRKVEPTGCGQCTACRLNYARDKATLLMMEKLYHGANTCWFITLTYKDEMLYFHTYKDEETGKTQLAYTLNNTVVAPPRMLIAFMENHLQADGSVTIPAALRPYMGGQEVLVPKQ